MKTSQVKGARVTVAMSGGVDSSLAAALLVRAGARVTGVFMKPWQPPELGAACCLWEHDREDALTVAAKLGIPLETWDVGAVYRRLVAEPMVRAYRSGRTPNPDVECNRHIKFGVFARRALREGAQFIATGHYARIVSHAGRLCIARGADQGKDQSYFLWNIPRDVLGRVVFPIGAMTKPEVRRQARQLGLPTAMKKDSQGICFIGPLDVSQFLSRRIKGRRGPIVHVDGRVLGEHRGAGLFTVGQRHGLDIKAGDGPYYVMSTDMRTNTVMVGAEADLMRDEIRLNGIQWFEPRPRTTTRLSVQIRYRTPAVSATVSRTGSVHFVRPVRAPAVGQSAVLYRGRRIVGGGVIR